MAKARILMAYQKNQSNQALIDRRKYNLAEQHKGFVRLSGKHRPFT